jgi:hypothetical protein
MKLFLLSLVLFQSFSAGAQIRDRKIIHAGESLSAYSTYRFPSYEEATILFKNGGTLKSRINFNMLLCSMQFIDSKGDTLEIAKPKDIDSIRFSNSIFFFNDSYFEILATSGSAKLIASRRASIEPVTLGAMGTAARNVSAESYATYKYIFSLPINLQLNEDVYIYDKTEYFLMTEAGEVFKATKNNFLRKFGSHKSDIENFLKSNKVNFNSESDLEKLFHFVLTL